MPENQPDADDELDLASEVANAQDYSLLEGAKQSLAGWRDTAGMPLNAAVAIDAVFLIIGAAMITQAGGLLSTAGYVVAGIGGLGLLEKVVRRIA